MKPSSTPRKHGQAPSLGKDPSGLEWLAATMRLMRSPVARRILGNLGDTPRSARDLADSCAATPSAIRNAAARLARYGYVRALRQGNEPIRFGATSLVRVRPKGRFIEFELHPSDPTIGNVTMRILRASL